MKKSFIHACLCIFISLISLSCKSQTLILYESIGLMDKPLPEIRIQEFCNEESNIKCFVLDKSNLKLLGQYIEKYKEVGHLHNNEYPYGAYKVILNTGKMEKKIVLPDKEEAYLFFKHQLELLQKNEKLYNEIKVLLKRLE